MNRLELIEKIGICFISLGLFTGVFSEVNLYEFLQLPRYVGVSAMAGMVFPLLLATGYFNKKKEKDNVK